MKETHRSLMRSGMGALLLLLLTLTACVGEELQKPLLGEGEGYLTLHIGAISAEIQTSPLTKTPTELDASLVPDKGNLKINIKDAADKVVKHYEKLSEINAPIVLQTGTYIVEAYHGENNDIQEKPYFYGRREVMIEALKNTKAEFTASLANAMITPVVSENLSKHYKDYSVTANVNGSIFEFPSGKSLFAAAERTISLTFTGTNQLGVETSYTSPATEALQAGKNYLLQCDPKFSECSSIQVNATIDPIIENGWLNGSKVSLSYSTSDNAKIDSISSWHVEVHYKDNGIDNIIRTYDSPSAPDSTIMTPAANWPYVPKDSEITAYVLIEDDTIHVKTSKTVKPISFGVEVSGDTSYSVYDRSGATEANKKDGSSIFNIGSTVKISDKILTNSNYANILPKVTYTTDTGKSSDKLAYNASVNNFTGLAWQKHILTATATFEGATASASIDCHVTGLPYTADFNATRNDKNWLGWTKNGDVDWIHTGLHMKLRFMGGFIVSPKFHIIDHIEVYVYMEGQRYKLASDGSFTVGPTTSINTLSSFGTSTSIGHDLNTKYSKYTCSLNSYMDTDKEYLSLKAAHNDTYIYLFKVTYQ